ncbi:MAG: hypothetical protein K5978_08450 [Campylobacter sp.]|nr:hypothetical protein [Campylobacter sp.]
MTPYTKAIFSEPVLLREKLAIYLQTPKKVELYASAAEFFFSMGNKEKLAKVPTWSWYGLFVAPALFMYRRDYVNMLISVFIVVFPCYMFAAASWESITIFGIIFMNFIYLIPIFYAMAAKYIIISKFEKILRLEDDEILKNKGGVNEFALLVGAILGIPLLFLGSGWGFVLIAAIVNGRGG